MTLSCAIVGAAFGYMLGLFIELFPGLNTAFMGVGGPSISALLAAIGFLAGLALGVVLGIVMFFTGRGRYERRMHGGRHWARRSFRYGGAYAMHGHHGFGCGRSEYESGASSVGDTLQEIDGYLSYLEDMPKDGLAHCEDKMDRLHDRLASLRASMQR